MNLNFIYRILVCLIICTATLFAQLSSFEKIYPSSGEYNSGHQVIEAGNNEYLIAGYDDVSTGSPIGKLKVSRFDSDGNIIWHRSFNTAHATRGITKPAIKINDNEYWLVSTGVQTDLEQVMLIKIDGNGNTLDSTYYSGDNKEFGFAIIKNGDNILLAVAKKVLSFSYNILKLINVGQDGNELWQKEYDIKSSSSIGYIIKSYNDSVLVAAGSDSLIFINKSGERLKALKPDMSINSVLVNNDNIIIGGPNHISMYDYNKNLIWRYDGTSRARILNVDDNNQFAVYTGSLNTKSLSLLDSTGELISTVPVRAEITDLICTGNSYYATGFSSSRLYFLKMNDQYTYTALDLLNPDGGEGFTAGQDISTKIEWYSFGIDAVDIDFSEDNGTIWAEVASSIPAAKAEYQWALPKINSTQCLIRLTGNPQNELSDKSSAPFSITPVYTSQNNYIAANNILMWIGNNGMSAHDPQTDGSGLYWPGGVTAEIPAVFADGILWGGKVDREIRVNGATYRYGLAPGPILDDGTADDPSKPENKVYKLKQGWENNQDSLDRSIYEFNYNNWPGEHGAPYTDVDGDDKFTRGVDEPLIIGEETLFYVSNDLNAGTTTFTYGTLPIGLEYQQTLFAYNTGGLRDAVFKKVKIINKSDKPVEDMYIAYWADDDLGYAGDDYVGCDTLLNLVYTYNGDNNDDDYYGDAPPAVGRVLLQGPITPSEKDTARVDNRIIPSYKNLPVTSAFLYIGGDSRYTDPELATPAGAEQFYNNYLGLLWDGTDIIDPNTSLSTHYALAGDPVNKTGWYEGDGWPGGPVPSDRRSVFATGPFNFEPGDTQSVVFAIFLARGTDNINSVEKLKEEAVKLHEFWGNKIPTSIEQIDNQIPERYSLSQNYPNPFNPTTTIEYTIPALTSSLSPRERVSEGRVRVTINVFDILGRKVATLVNERQSPGKYKVQFDGSRLTSGVYFYRLTAGNLSKTNKMILLR